MIASTSEREAIERLRRGDIGGLEPLVRRYQLQAVRAATLITRDRAQAEDIVQGAFIRAYERIAQFDPTRPFGPWFLRGVVNDALKAARRERRQQPLGDDDWGATIDTLEADPERLAELLETAHSLQAALDQLPAEQRAAVVLRYYLDLSEVETARRLGSPLGTIKWRLHAARARLRQLLRPDDPAATRSVPDE
ncbi:MAG TPA: sigma-70 family RNA polymerase sigma factor [Thermomicrobiaceae bacterium]|nr:sigma-70 family RNA polymerase sigma factor [Thermomicrobiaceae bacterium]